MHGDPGDAVGGAVIGTVTLVVGGDVPDAVTSAVYGDVACTVSLAVGSEVIDAVMLFNGGAIVGVVTLSEDSIVGTVTFGGSGVAGIVTFPEIVVVGSIFVVEAISTLHSSNCVYAPRQVYSEITMQSGGCFKQYLFLHLKFSAFVEPLGHEPHAPHSPQIPVSEHFSCSTENRIDQQNRSNTLK